MSYPFLGARWSAFPHEFCGTVSLLLVYLVEIAIRAHTNKSSQWLPAIPPHRGLPKKKKKLKSFLHVDNCLSLSTAEAFWADHLCCFHPVSVIDMALYHAPCPS
jgi:hypothetical protein